MEQLEKIQANQLRALLYMEKTTPYTGILMETGIWPIRKKIEYQTMMMYFSLINSDNKRLAKLVIQQQRKYTMPNTLYTKVRQISNTINVNIDQANIIKKSRYVRKDARNE